MSHELLFLIQIFILILVGKIQFTIPNFDCWMKRFARAVQYRSWRPEWLSSNLCEKCFRWNYLMKYGYNLNHKYVRTRRGGSRSTNIYLKQTSESAQHTHARIPEWKKKCRPVLNVKYLFVHVYFIGCVVDSVGSFVRFFLSRLLIFIRFFLHRFTDIKWLLLYQMRIHILSIFILLLCGCTDASRLWRALFASLPTTHSVEARCCG